MLTKANRQTNKRTRNFLSARVLVMSLVSAKQGEKEDSKAGRPRSFINPAGGDVGFEFSRVELS